MRKALFVLIVFALAAPAHAELLFFAGERSMSVAGHRFEGDRIVVSLRGGGEMTFDRALILSISPDEVPYPTPGAQPEQAAGLRPSSTSFDPLIERAADEHGVPVRLLKAVIQVESSFEPRARSPKGAMGLMQLMPATAREYEAHNPYDPKSNIEAGTRYLGKLLREFELPLALAAYNAGEAAVRRFGGIPPYAETQAYVAKILALLR